MGKSRSSTGLARGCVVGAFPNPAAPHVHAGTGSIARMSVVLPVPGFQPGRFVITAFFHVLLSLKPVVPGHRLCCCRAGPSSPLLRAGCGRLCSSAEPCRSPWASPLWRQLQEPQEELGQALPCLDKAPGPCPFCPLRREEPAGPSPAAGDMRGLCGDRLPPAGHWWPCTASNTHPTHTPGRNLPF